MSAGLLRLELLRSLADIVLNDVIAQHHTDLLPVGEMFGQSQRVGDAALAFLVSVINMLQSEFLAIGQQP